MTDNSGARAPQGAQLFGGESTSAGRSEIWIGLDTGGTFTDAVALDGERRVMASAKALTALGSLFLAEAVVRSRATGRPAAGHAP